MQPERRIVFIRKARMSARRMQSSEEGFNESVALAVPLVQIGEKKRRVASGQPDPSPIAGWRQRPAAGQLLRYGVEQALNEGPELRVRRRPVSADMCHDALIQVSL